LPYGKSEGAIHPPPVKQTPTEMFMLTFAYFVALGVVQLSK